MKLDDQLYLIRSILDIEAYLTAPDPPLNMNDRGRKFIFNVMHRLEVLRQYINDATEDIKVEDVID
jgi:hypothetical protein